MVGVEKYNPGYPPVVKQIVDPKSKNFDLKSSKSKQTDQRIVRAQMREF
jgi:hypothetical protein